MPPKKSDKHREEKHRPEKHREEKHPKSGDLRRAFEHLGRVHLLQPSIEPAHTAEIDGLLALARRELAERHEKNAAELLRAAEHLCFAAIAGEPAEGAKLSTELIAAVREEVDHLASQAAKHRKDEPTETSEVSKICETAKQRAAEALRAGACHRALELSRAVEALAHVKAQAPRKLQAPPPRRALRSS